jgi:hypothetical protein
LKKNLLTFNNMRTKITISLSTVLLAFGEAALIERQVTSDYGASCASLQVPDYFNTVDLGPPGPTATGQAPFLAAIDPVPGFGLPSGTRSYDPNTPLETSEPITDNADNINVFQYMGQLGSYFPNPVGFGAEEYSLPSTCNITQVHVLHRHGSRYPSTGSNIQSFAGRLQNATATGFSATGDLSYISG